MANGRRWCVLGAIAMTLALGLVGPASANYSDPLRIGMSNNDNCGGGYCPVGGTHLSAASADFPDSALLVHNNRDGFGVTGESTSGTGLRALAHGAATALWAENDSTGAGLVAKGLWGDGIFATSYSGINKSGVYGESKSGAGYGVVGRTDAGGKAAVWGDNIGGGAGVEGETTGNFASAVYGHHGGSNPGFGVWGETVNGQGVVGKSTNGSGTEGVTSGATASGVWGHHEGSNAGWGVYGHAKVGTGVHGDGTVAGVDGSAVTAGGIGVRATNTAGGPALRVNGKASFSRSGVIKLSVAAAYAKVSGMSLTSSSYVLATLQTDTAGLYIRSAVPAPAASTITIHFNTTAPAGTRVAWFVVN